MNTLEKITSLLNSRRFWMLVAQGASVLVALVSMIAPLLNFEINISDMPELEPEALANTMFAFAQNIAALTAGVTLVWKMLSNTQAVSADYTTRPAGVADRVGLVTPENMLANITYAPKAKK